MVSLRKNVKMTNLKQTQMISNLYKDKSSEIDLFGTLQLASPRFAMLDCLL